MLTTCVTIPSKGLPGGAGDPIQIVMKLEGVLEAISLVFEGFGGGDPLEIFQGDPPPSKRVLMITVHCNCLVDMREPTSTCFLKDLVEPSHLFQQKDLGQDGSFS